MKTILILTVAVLASIASAEQLEVGGSARIRTETRDNSDFSNAGKDYLQFTGSRIRVHARWRPSERLSVFVEPQFSKTWGEPELIATSPTANTAVDTSGALHDTGLDIHQAYVTYLPAEHWQVHAGRKELVYGDQLLVGPVGWHNVGRSFDLLQTVYSMDRASVEAFHTKIVDRNSKSAAAGDKEFSGMYLAYRLSDWLQNADAYVFYSKDGGADPMASTLAYGLRLKSPVGRMDYRGEVTFENLRGSDDAGARQFDVELGYLLHESSKTRLSAEYFAASENFDQLYPTGHKWLGYADLFSRRNITGYRAGLSAQVTEAFRASVDYHKFEREKSAFPAYRFNGTAYGAAGDGRDIAGEVDVVLGYKLDGGIDLEAGAARVFAGGYLRENSAPDPASFYYLQATAGF